MDVQDISIDHRAEWSSNATAPHTRFQNLLDDDPAAEMFYFADKHGLTRDTLTRKDLDQKARKIAAQLNRHNLKPGDRALLCYSFSIDVVPAVLGCFYAGVVPCPIAPPNPTQLDNELQRFEELVSDCGCKVVLTNNEYARYRKLATLRSPWLTRNTLWRNLPWLKTDGNLPPPIREKHFAKPDELALLQYTSGSTSAPKGVMVTFRNITAQIDCIHERYPTSNATRLVAWIPYYHDHCLIGGILNVMLGGGSLYLMSPQTFLKNPAAWFDLLTRVRATGTVAPNFALNYAVRKTSEAQRRRWDLSSIDIFQSGGEPILVQSVELFLDAFEPSKLRPESFAPAYGMAEHVLGIAMGGGKSISIDPIQYEHAQQVVESEGKTARTLLGNGKPLAGVQVEIVDPENCRRLGANAVGEIWLNSDSKAAGYWNKPELSKSVFAACIADETSSNRYLRTGDLGFFHAGELFVSGRIKDTIVLRGRNIYPQDVEAVVSTAHKSIRPGRSVAFSNTNDSEGECMAILAEVKAKPLRDDEAQAIAVAIRRQVTATLGVNCHTVILTTPGTILKTSSGKHQRSKTRAHYLQGLFAKRVLWRDTLPAGLSVMNENARPEQLTESIILDRLKTHVATIEGLQSDAVDADAPLDSFAFDSLALMGIVVDLQNWSGCDVSLEALVKAGTLRRVARVLLELDQSAAVGAVDLRAIAEPKKQAVLPAEERLYPLNPSQAWLFEPDGPLPHGWCIGGMVQTIKPMDSILLQQALDAVIKQHEALRMRLVATEHGWQQRILVTESPQVECIDLTELRGDALRTAIKHTIAAKQQAMDFINGPIVRIVVLRLGELQYDRMLLLVHHIAVDAYSMELVAADLLRSYEQLLLGKPSALAVSSTGYIEWAERLTAMAKSKDVRAAADMFMAMPRAPRLTLDNPQGRNSKGKYVAQRALLSHRKSRQLLHSIPLATGLPAATIVLTTLCQALHEHLQETLHGFELVHHGRGDTLDSVDLSRTCGWISINCPVTLAIEPALDTIAQARQFQALISRLPRNGLDYGLLAYMHPDREFCQQFRHATRPQMKFMWYGQTQGMLQTFADRYPPAPELVGTSYEPEREAHYLQYFYAAIIDGCVRLDVGSSQDCYTDSTRQTLLSLWLKKIDKLIDR